MAKKKKKKVKSKDLIGTAYRKKIRELKKEIRKHEEYVQNACTKMNDSNQAHTATRGKLTDAMKHIKQLSSRISDANDVGDEGMRAIRKLHKDAGTAQTDAIIAMGKKDQEIYTLKKQIAEVFGQSGLERVLGTELFPDNPPMVTNIITGHAHDDHMEDAMNFVGKNCHRPRTILDRLDDLATMNADFKGDYNPYGDDAKGRHLDG